MTLDQINFDARGRRGRGDVEAEIDRLGDKVAGIRTRKSNLPRISARLARQASAEREQRATIRRPRAPHAAALPAAAPDEYEHPPLQRRTSSL